jgi:hypothetical protein
MAHKTTLTPGAIEVDHGSLVETKEDIRIDQLIPSEILEDKTQLTKFLEAYYTFMNMDEFIYQETETFNEVVLNNQIQFRIPDPNNDNNRFFTDETGADSTLVLTDPSGTTTTITLTDVNVAITNGNELPGTLATSTSEIGKTFTVNGLSGYNNYTAKLTTIVKYWVGPGPSYVMNTIESAMDIDRNAQNYLELMQKEIAATIPRDLTVNKRTLYKQIIDFYKLRGSADSIEIFFKILFNDEVEVEFPYDSVLIPSSGNWEANPALSKGGQYLDNKGFLSYNIRLQDSFKYQKFAYLIKTGKNLSDWELSYDRLVHPAGFIYFAEILIFLQLTGAVLTDALTLSRMPGVQPGIIGPEDIPVLVEMFVSMFLPQTTAKIHRSGTLSLDLKNGVINSRTITSGGSGYTSVPVVTSVDSGTPSGYTTATLTAALTNGSVSDITIGNGGKDYNVPTLTIAAPSAITFDGSDDEVLGTGIVNLTNNTIKLTSAQQAALPVGAVVTYATTGTAISGLVSGTQYFIKTSTGDKVSLSATNGGAEIDITGVGSGTSHSFTGETATATATKLDGALENVTIVEPGFGYASAPAVTFNGIDISGQTGVAPTVTIGIDSKGRLDQDNITINTEGSNWSNLFGSVAANANEGQIAELEAIGKSDKRYTTAPSIVFPEPQAKDALGNLLSTNVTATAEFTLDSEGEITGVSITNAGNGYITDPEVRLGSAVNNEIRVADQQEILDLSLNHNDAQPITSTVVNPRQTSGSQDGRTLYDNGRIRDNVIGIVTSVTVDAGGSGYSSATVTFSGGGATVPATGTVTLTGDAVSSISITSGGYGYTSAPTVTISGDGTSASATATVNLNWNITQSSSSAVKFLPEHRVKVVNSNFRTIINNGYKQRKGPENFFTSPRLYNTNQTIAFLGSNTIETINSNDINKYNTSTFVHIE